MRFTDGRATVRRRSHIVLGACLVVLAAPAAAAAQAPAPDAYEPNDEARVASPLAPEALVVAATGAADPDWYSIKSQAAGWPGIFTGGPLRVDIRAERLTTACADESLRLTLYVDDEFRSSHAVYRGGPASILTFDPDPGSHYDVRLDTGFDPACSQPLYYALRAVPFPPLPVLQASGVKYSQHRCEGYTGEVRRLTREIRRKKGKKRAALIKQRTTATKNKRKACAKK